MGTSKKDGGMGFKDIENFNLALLGKQAWRILQHPNCLMSKILKGRYFADTNVLNATPKRKASYVWRSILQGRNLLRQGLRFVIGDGSLINIATDPWLPLHPPRAPRLNANGFQFLQVSDLLHQTGNGWNESRVREIIAEEDVNTVLSLKLCRSATKDYLGWHYTKDGLYTVKSAYWLANQLQLDHQATPPPGDTRLKAATWNLKTAPKIKHFMWRLLSGALPTGENLKRRHITNAIICRRCCQDEETTKHLFFDCMYAQSIWRASGYSHHCLIDPLSSLDDKLDVILSSPIATANPQLHHLGIWLLWRLWKSRNLLVFQQRALSWQNSLALAKNDAREWVTTNMYLRQLQEPAAQIITTRCPSNQQRWKRPPTDWIKCNYDGSFVNNSIPAKAGWLFRDTCGNYLGAGQATGYSTPTAYESEWQSLLFSMQHAWTKGYRKIIFEGDNKQLVEVINQQSLHFGFLNWYRDVNHWKEKFEEVIFTWTPRLNNQPADKLACHTNSLLYNNYVHVPLVISNLLQSDYVNSISN